MRSGYRFGDVKERILRIGEELIIIRIPVNGRIQKTVSAKIDFRWEVQISQIFIAENSSRYVGVITGFRTANKSVVDSKNRYF